MHNKKINIILVMILSFEILYWIVQFFMCGKWIDTYFSNDLNDTGMDFFNMLSNIFYADPYKFNSNYPALCFIIWRILFHIMPINDNCGDSFYLRTYMPAQLGYILFNLFCIILIWEMVKLICKDLEVNTVLFAIVVAMSGPLLFTIERGNIIILAFAMLLVFFAFYDSEKKWQRYVAYVALAVSASVKIYPALFGILILLKRRYKEAAITMIIGIIVFLTPFFCFGGINSIKSMLNGIMMTSTDNISLGNNYNFSMRNVLNIISDYLGSNVNISSLIVLFVSVAICFGLFAISKKTWQRILAISMLCIWIPAFSYTYTLLFLIIPFLYFLKEEKINSYRYIFLICYIIIMCPIALPLVGRFNLQGVKFPLGYPTLIINVAIIILIISSLIESIVLYFKWKLINKEKNIIDTLENNSKTLETQK